MFLGMEAEPKEEKTAWLLTFLSWVVYIFIGVVSSYYRWVILFIPIIMLLSFIVAVVADKMYGGFNPSYTLWSKIKTIFLISLLVPLSIPWIIKCLRRDYLEEIIQDIIE